MIEAIDENGMTVEVDPVEMIPSTGKANVTVPTYPAGSSKPVYQIVTALRFKKTDRSLLEFLLQQALPGKEIPELKFG